MYGYICVRECVARIFVYVCLRLHVYVRMAIYVCVCICVCLYLCMHVCMSTWGGGLYTCMFGSVNI